MRQEEISNFNDSFERYKDRITNFSNDFEFGLFVYILKRALPVIIGILTISVLLSVLYLRYAEPIYSASTKLQLGKSDQANKILKVSEYMADDQLSSEVELLRSNLLIAKTVEDMDLQVRYFAQGEVRSSEHYASSPFEIEVGPIRDSTIFGQSVFVLFKEDQSFSLSIGEESFGPFYPLVDSKTPAFDFKLRIIRARDLPTLAANNEYYFTINDLRSLVAYFSSRVTIGVLNATAKTISITVTDGNRTLARDFAAKHAQTYLRYDIERKEESAENVLFFIDSQLDTVSQNLSDAEFLINSFKQEYKIPNLEEVSNIYLDRLTGYQDDIMSIELQQNVLDEVARISDRPLEDIDVYQLISILVGTEYEQTVSRLLRELEELLQEREEAYFSVTKENDRVKALGYQIDIQKKLIVQSVNSLKEKLESRRKLLLQRENAIERNFEGMPAKELEFARLQRLFDINEKYYTILLEKKIEYRISKAGFVSDNKVLTEARYSSKPIRPVPAIVYFGVIGVGLLISILFLIARYLLHNNITSLNEIAKLSQASIGVLGLVPKFKESVPVSQLIIDKNPKSLIAESFRTIRTNMQFVDNTPGAKTVAITSTISGEGKTFVALNLAGIIAYSGKRVIIIDLDMRKPKIHKGFGVENTIGMSTILIGRDSIASCVRKSPIESLHFITAGPVPPNPSELVISEAMGQTIEKLKNDYDYIIIDNPPVGLVTDGITAIKNADYPIYIFRADYSKNHFVQNVDRLINENGISKLSVILNSVDVERNKYGYYYGYGYGYGYGYAYGNDYSGYYSADAKKKPWYKRIFG